MSAPLTPEQRETLAQELERVQLALRTFPNALGHYELADALRAALSQPARTCGSCQHAQKTENVLLCRNQDAMGSFVATDWSVDPDDGCLKHWTPRETETP